MNLQQLRYFYATAQVHSIRAASENLYVSQSTISESIKALEEELQAPLFERRKTGMQLTPFGWQILTDVQEIIRHIWRIETQSKEQQIKQKRVGAGALSINLIAAVCGHAAFSEAIDTFKAANPQIKLYLADNTMIGIVKNVEGRAYDLGVVYCDSHSAYIMQRDDVLVQKLHTENYYILVNTRHPLAANTSVNVRQVCQQPIAVLSRNSPNDFGVDTYPILKEAPLDVVFRTVDPTGFQKFLLKNDDVIGFMLPDSLCASLAIDGKLTAIRVNSPHTIDVYCLYRQDAAKRSLIEEFVDDLRQKFVLA